MKKVINLFCEENNQYKNSAILIKRLQRILSMKFLSENLWFSLAVYGNSVKTKTQINMKHNSTQWRNLLARFALVMLIALTAWTKSSAQTTTLINPATDGGFELGGTFAANGWTVANYVSSVNQWVIGTSTTTGMTAPFSGNRAYISSDNGLTNGYSTTASSKVYKIGRAHV